MQETDYEVWREAPYSIPYPYSAPVIEAPEVTWTEETAVTEEETSTDVESSETDISLFKEAKLYIAGKNPMASPRVIDMAEAILNGSWWKEHNR